MQSSLLLLLPVITIICSHVFCDIAANATENNKAEKTTKRGEALDAGRRGQLLPLASPAKRDRKRENIEWESLPDTIVAGSLCFDYIKRVNLSQISETRKKGRIAANKWKNESKWCFAFRLFRSGP